MAHPRSQVEVFPAIGTNDREQALSPLEHEVIGLFDEMRQRLLRYLLQFRLTLQDAEEIVQETFLALFQHLRRGRSRENLRGWLFRVAHNLALKKLQRERRDSFHHPATEAAVQDQIADPAPSAEEELVRAQTHGRMQAVLRALPEQDRQCLHLRAEGLRYREIAQVLEISLGAVAISLERSLARMARAAER
jgi:RNA polymerase sigma-70 factor, ECF subfamily